MRIIALVLLGNMLFGASYLEKEVSPNHGVQETLLHIEQLGRYRVEVKSSTGCTIEIVDAMAGPIASAGETGKADGFLDVFLDVGTYKIRSVGIVEPAGELKWVLSSFNRTWLDTPRETEIVTSQLEDLQEKAFWLHVQAGQTIRLELMGRNLREARIWYPGDWMDYREPVRTIREAVPGKPMTHLEFSSVLTPGIYRVSCYGGQAMEWASEDGSSPLYMRLGVPTFGISGRAQFEISPFGVACFSVSSEANFLQVRLPEKADLRLSRASLKSTGSRFSAEDDWETLSPKSRSKILTLWGSSGSDRQWVRVKAAPGTKCELRFFKEDRLVDLPRDQKHFLVTTLSSFEADNALDISSVLVHPDREIPLDVQCLRVGLNNTLVRRVNILGENELFVWIEDAGDYTILEHNGTNLCEYRLQPFFKYSNKKPRPFVLAGEPLPLTTGIYTLTIKPRQKGVLHFSFGLENKSSHEVPDPGTGYSDFSMSPVTITRDREFYTLQLNARQEIWVGLDVRSLPVDLKNPLTLIIKPGQKFNLDCLVPPGYDLCVSNHELGYSLDGLRLPPDQSGIISNIHFPNQRNRIVINNNGSTAAWVSLSLMPSAQDDPDPAGLIDVCSSMTVLNGDESFFADFGKKQRQAYVLDVAESGLYRLETSGRLAMSINVRTRLDTGLFYAVKNGIGRNALVQEYLKNGTYLVLIDAMGSSSGRVGIHLKKQDLQEGTLLRSGAVVKGYFEAGQARRYPVQIDEAGTYSIETIGIDKVFRVRFEDPEGWPLLKSTYKGGLTLDLQKGTHLYYTLASPVESRRITTFKREQVLLERSGKGPHTLRWGVSEELVWRDGEPDVFIWNLPAKIAMDISLSTGMLGVVFLDETEITAFQGGKKFSTTFEKGTYRLEIRREIEDEYYPYTFLASTEVLAPGILQERERFPVDIKLALGADSLVNLQSMGSVDVKAKLLNHLGHEVLKIDDGPLDWNLNYSGRLPAGGYLLSVDKNGSTNGKVTFSLKTKREIRVATQSNLSWKGSLDDQVLKVPFSVDRDGIYHIYNQVQGEMALNYALQYAQEVTQEISGEMWVPLKRETDYVLWIWNPDETAVQLELSAGVLEAKALPPAKKTDLKPNSLSSFMAEGLTSFKVPNRDADFLASSEWNQPMVKVSDYLHPGPTGLWVKTNQQQVKMEPFTIRRGTSTSFLLGTHAAKIQLIGKTGKDPLNLFSVTSAGLDLLGGPTHQESPYWQAMDFTNGETFFADMGSNAIMRVWNGRPGSEMEHVHLRYYSLADVDQGMISDGMGKMIEISPGESILWHIPVKTPRLSVLMEPGLITLTGDEGQVLSLNAARTVNRMVYLEGEYKWLRISNTSKRSARCRLTRATHSGSGNTLSWDSEKGIAWHQKETEFLQHSVEITSDLPVFSTKGLRDVIFYRSDGAIIQEFPLTPAKGADPLHISGKLQFKSGAGFHKIWSSAMGQEEINLVHAGFNNRLTLTAQPGLNPMGNLPQIWGFNVQTPGWILFSSLKDWYVAISSVSSNQQIPMIRITGSEQRIVFLEAGDYFLHTASKSPESQTNAWTMKTLITRELIEGEDLPSIFIAENEWHAYSFNVEHEAAVGIGIVSQSQGFRGFLFGPDRQLLSESSFIYQTLPVGTYTYIVGLNGEPQIYYPRILGIKERANVPENEMRKYMEEQR